MKSNKGFTLAELVIVLSLLGIVLTGIISFLGYSIDVFGDTRARTVVQDDVSNALKLIASDIRSASKPDLTIRSIMVYKGSNASDRGDRIDIYDYKDNKYSLVSYKYDDKVLYRGVKEADKLEDIIGNTGVDYSVFLEGIIYPTETDLFEDITTNPGSDRRTIRINLIAEDKEGKINKPVVITATYTSRSKGMP